MLEVQKVIADYLYAHWIGTDPLKGDIDFHVGPTLFDEVNCDPQITITELGTRETKRLVCNGLYRCDREITITVYLKLVHPDFASKMTTFNNMLNEVDRVLNDGRYLVAGINWITLTGWRQETDLNDEPVYLKATQTLVVTYYEES